MRFHQSVLHRLKAATVVIGDQSLKAISDHGHIFIAHVSSVLNLLKSVRYYIVYKFNLIVHRDKCHDIFESEFSIAVKSIFALSCSSKSYQYIKVGDNMRNSQN